LGKGTPKTIVVDLDYGRLIATGTVQNALLFVLTTHDAKLGLILVRLEKCASKVKEILQ
jgi:predicted regulator of Ras-like GTPase activity (Roadblock/LC7/MglB family)